MPILFEKNLARFCDAASGEEAEGLLEWLQKWPAAKADLSECSHLHPANLQVLLAAGTRVAAWPNDLGLSAWLKTVLRSK
jgi:hypothetical protein